MVLRLGALESQSEGRLALTPFGRQILEAEGETKARIVIERFMRKADLVKFARLTPTAEECRTALDLGEEIVRRTIPAFVTAEAGAAPSDDSAFPKDPAVAREGPPRSEPGGDA